jgi:hypothetical protein
MIEFTGISQFNNELIISNCLIQKYICDKKHILLRKNGIWLRIKNESLTIEIKDDKNNYRIIKEKNN